MCPSLIYRCLLDQDEQATTAAQALVDEQIERMVLWDDDGSKQEGHLGKDGDVFKPLSPSQVVAAIIVQENRPCVRTLDT
jgi:hypothetical protein